MQTAARTARLAASEARREAELEALKQAGRLEGGGSVPGYNPYLEKRLREQAARAARERAELEVRMAARMSESKSRVAAQLERERALRQKARCDRATARPLPHVNPEGRGGGPRTVCEPSGELVLG